MSAVNQNKVIPGASYQASGWVLSNPINYDLHLLITAGQLVYLLLEKSSGKVVLLQPVLFTGTLNREEWVKAIDAILENNSFLNNEFAEKKMCVFSPVFTIVPSGFSNPDVNRTLLAFNTVLRPGDEVMSEEVQGAGMSLIYAMPANLLQRLGTSFTGIHVQHALTGLLRFLLKQNDTRPNHLNLYIQSNSFQVIYIKDRVVWFCNSFAYSSPEDFMYHLLFACKQLHLEPEKLTLTLMGEILKESILFQLMLKYIRQIEFTKPYSGVQFGEDYSIPGHFFFNLFCI